MSSPFNEQIEQVMAQFTEQRTKLQETQRDLQKATVTASPKDHLLTVTMGVSGEVKDIKFHRNDYATMAPAELSAILVDTLNKARELAAAKAQAAFSSMAGFSSGLRDSLAGGSELDDIFGLLDGTTTPAPKRVDRDEEDFDG
jgi:DNA-binding protein YbaB